MSKVILYQISPSFYSQIARLALVEKQVPWKEHLINIGPPLDNYKPWYMRINPRGVVPTLEHNGEYITDSFRIIRYIDEHFDGPSLIPEDPALKAEMDDWLEILDAFPTREFSYGSRFDGTAGKWISRLQSFSYKMRRKALRKYKKSHPDLAEHYEARLQDIDEWEKTCANAIEMDKIYEQMRALLERLDAALEGKEWLVGESYTLADLVWTAFFARFKMFGRAHMWDNLERVKTYFQRLEARPGFQKADIWLKVQPKLMFRIMAPFVLSRLAAATLVLTAIVGASWYYWPG